MGPGGDDVRNQNLGTEGRRDAEAKDKRKNRTKETYLQVAEDLVEMGFHRHPWDRVRDKVYRLKTEYRKIRDQKRMSGADLYA